MKTKLFFLGLLALVVSLNSMGQCGEIEIVEQFKFLPPTYKKCDIQLSKEQFINLFKDDPKLTGYYNSLNLHYGVDALLSASAGILVFWPVTQKLNKKEPDWYLAYIGAGCFALSIPFKMAFHKKAKEAVNYYNSEIIKEETMQFNLNLNQNGIGLVMTF